MKTILRSLAFAVLCSVGITSCVYDDPGYYAGPRGGYYGPGYSSVSVGLYDGYYGGYGYPYRGYGYSPYRYSSYRYPSHYHGSYHGPYRGRGGSYPYAASVGRSSSFRGSTLSSTPPSFRGSSPRTLPRSTSFSAAPSGRGSRPVSAAVSAGAAVSGDHRRSR